MQTHEYACGCKSETTESPRYYDHACADCFKANHKIRCRCGHTFMQHGTGGNGACCMKQGCICPAFKDHALSGTMFATTVPELDLAARQGHLLQPGRATPA